MPTVAVLNMAGKEVEKIELAEGVFGIEPKFPAAAESRGDRRAQAVQDRAPPELRSGHTAASCSHRSREITPSPSTRR